MYPGLKLDEKSILKMVSKVRNFWLCVFSGVVATTLIDHDSSNFLVDR